MARSPADRPAHNERFYDGHSPPIAPDPLEKDDQQDDDDQKGDDATADIHLSSSLKSITRQNRGTGGPSRKLRAYYSLEVLAVAPALLSLLVVPVGCLSSQACPLLGLLHVSPCVLGSGIVLLRGLAMRAGLFLVMLGLLGLERIGPKGPRAFDLGISFLPVCLFLASKPLPLLFPVLLSAPPKEVAHREGHREYHSRNDDDQ